MIPLMIWRRDAHPTYRIGVHSVTPVAQSIGIRWRRGGWLWQFPLAVEVENEESGAQTRLPIPDPTRTIVWFFYALTVLVILATTLAAWQKRQPARAIITHRKQARKGKHHV